MSNNDRCPPYAAIARLVDHVCKTESEDFNRRMLELGPIGNRDHILHAAHEVQDWLDLLLMTQWAQDTMDRHR